MEILKQAITNTVFLTYIGAISGHILSLYSSEFKGAVPFLEKMFPNRSSTFYFRTDFLLLPILGAIIGYVLLDPANVKASIFTGLSWSGTLTALLKRNSDKINQNLAS